MYQRPVFIVLFMLMLLAACQQPQTNDADNAQTQSSELSDKRSEAMHSQHEQEKVLLKKMQWLLEANAQEDAEAALALIEQGQKPQLIAFSNRMLNFPGLTLEEYASIEQQVSYTIPAGSGDVLFGDEHLKMQKKLFAYAETYNNIIYTALLPRQ